MAYVMIRSPFGLAGPVDTSANQYGGDAIIRGGSTYTVDDRPGGRLPVVAGTSNNYPARDRSVPYGQYRQSPAPTKETPDGYGFSQPILGDDDDAQRQQKVDYRGLDYGEAPARIPITWRPHLDYWAGLRQRGMQQAWHQLRISPPFWRDVTRGRVSVRAGSYPGGAGASRMRVRSTFVPVAM